MTPSLESREKSWSLPKKFLLRFSFIYWICYIFPYGFEYLTWLTPNDFSDISPWTGITQWFGETFLGWTFNPDRLAKGFDSKYDFARFMLCAVIAMIGSAIWLLIDNRKNWQYNGKLNTLMRTMLRYHVGFTLILYGIAKVFLYQFGYTGLDRMDVPVGEQSPMGLLWFFMSYSPTYNITTGLIEIIGGILLFFRPTTLLGAIISFVAMANVVLIDISYDVTVKMFAIHLTLMVVVLLLDDFKRLIDLMVLNKATKPVIWVPLFDQPRSKYLSYIAKTVMLGYILFTMLMFSSNISSKNRMNRQQAIIPGKYEVETFVVNGDSLPPLKGDSQRWEKLMLGSSYSPTSMTLTDMAGGVKRYVYEVDTLKKSLTYHPRRDTVNQVTMDYEITDDNKFVLHGIVTGDTLDIRMSIFRREDYRLGRGKINWIRDLN